MAPLDFSTIMKTSAQIQIASSFPSSYALVYKRSCILQMSSDSHPPATNWRQDVRNHFNSQRLACQFLFRIPIYSSNQETLGYHCCSQYGGRWRHFSVLCFRIRTGNFEREVYYCIYKDKKSCNSFLPRNERNQCALGMTSSSSDLFSSYNSLIIWSGL